jgi:lipopolysaccharide transport system ATP-binding protein
MSRPIIEVESISKLYHLRGGALSLRELTDRWWQKMQGKNARNLKPRPESHFITEDQQGADADTFWALKDVSFTVQEGDVLGVIGRNGAGKSTLLKILSRITEPTSGKAVLRGRLASLLEVGTGFHPDLTGRENIYLNGTILGMRKWEITKRLDEIIAFAEVEKFVDTPVKHYSSGMYVRLAFAVAAHLEADILLIDEVLAVGDISFQKKCLGKMGDVAHQGKTILFVSHSMIAVQALCSKSLFFSGGQIRFQGPSRKAITQYLDENVVLTQTDLAKRTDRQGSGRIRFVKAWLEDNDGKKIDTALSGQEVSIVAEYEASDDKPLGIISVAFAIYGSLGEQLADLWNQSTGAIWEKPPSKGRVICRLPKIPLNAGRYTFNICSYVNDMMADWVHHAGVFNVVAGDFFGTGTLPAANQGSFLFHQEWQLDRVQKTQGAL